MKGREPHRFGDVRTQVSILVLLDVDERRASVVGEHAVVRMFQSLFSWMSMKGSLPSPLLALWLGVSILVLLDVDERPYLIRK